MFGDACFTVSCEWCGGCVRCKYMTGKSVLYADPLLFLGMSIMSGVLSSIWPISKGRVAMCVACSHYFSLT